MTDEEFKREVLKRRKPLRWERTAADVVIGWCTYSYASDQLFYIEERDTSAVLQDYNLRLYTFSNVDDAKSAAQLLADAKLMEMFK